MSPRANLISPAGPFAPTRRSVRRLPSSSADAKDEGPRLIPLDKQPEDLQFCRFNYYLDLADRLSKNKRVKGQEAE
jgi:hypothetical protein